MIMTILTTRLGHATIHLALSKLSLDYLITQAIKVQICS